VDGLPGAGHGRARVPAVAGLAATGPISR